MGVAPLQRSRWSITVIDITDAIPMEGPDPVLILDPSSFRDMVAVVLGLTHHFEVLDAVVVLVAVDVVNVVVRTNFKASVVGNLAVDEDVTVSAGQRVRRLE